MPRIILQRAEEVFPALKESLCCTVLLPVLQWCSATSVTYIDAYDVISVKREEESDIECQEEGIPIAILFPTVKCEQDEC